MKIFVMGDAGVDRYVVGEVRGMSAEASIPIVDVVGTLELPGMAGNVTANLKCLGADVTFLPLHAPVPVKSRLMTTSGVQLARWDADDQCTPYQRADLVALLEADAIIVSDYGKGAISDDIIEVLRHSAVPIFVDTKGDPGRWIGADVTMFPNWQEYKAYEEKYGWFPRVVLKRGAQGIAFLEFGSVVVSRPAQAQFVKSVNGAGDTVIASFALAALAGLTLPECLDFANAAAANVVEQPFGDRWTTADAVCERMYADEETTSASADLQLPGAGAVSRFGLACDRGSAEYEGLRQITANGATDPAGSDGVVSGPDPAVDVEDFTVIFWPPLA